MKTFWFFLIIVWVGEKLQAQISFAILPLQAATDVKPGDKESAESKLYETLISSKKYTIVDRSRIELIVKEQNFQLSDFTDQKKTAELGKIAGIQKLIAVKIYIKKEKQFAVSISVIDVSTAQVEWSAEESFKDYAPASLARLCAGGVVLRYPLTGKVIGIKDGQYFIDLGEDHGIKKGERIFVARKNVIRDDAGNMLMEEFIRIGLLEILQAEKNRSKAALRQLQDNRAVIMREDMVSNEPIPPAESAVSQSPLLSNISKGKLLLEDDMSKNTYLSVTGSKGENYVSGKLNIDASTLKTGHAYCYYPTPFDKLRILFWKARSSLKRSRVNLTE